MALGYKNSTINIQFTRKDSQKKTIRFTNLFFLRYPYQKYNGFIEKTGGFNSTEMNPPNVEIKTKVKRTPGISSGYF